MPLELVNKINRIVRDVLADPEVPGFLTQSATVDDVERTIRY